MSHVGSHIGHVLAVTPHSEQWIVGHELFVGNGGLHCLLLDAHRYMRAQRIASQICTLAL